MIRVAAEVFARGRVDFILVIVGKRGKRVVAISLLLNEKSGNGGWGVNSVRMDY